MGYFGYTTHIEISVKKILCLFDNVLSGLVLNLLGCMSWESMVFVKLKFSRFLFSSLHLLQKRMTWKRSFYVWPCEIRSNTVLKVKLRLENLQKEFVLWQEQEMKVKKQFNETCRIADQQHRMLRKQMLATTPREQHQEILKKLKEDKVRKFNELAIQYEKSINDILQNQKVRK